MRSIQGIAAVHWVSCVLLYSAVVAQARPTPQQRVVCSGTPVPTDNVRPWPQRCADAAAGFTCRARCVNSSNRATAVCNANGAWSVLSNNCPVAPRSIGCTQQPAAVAGATWQCNLNCNSSSAVGTVCSSTTCSEGFSGPGYVATCLRSGRWSKPVAASNSSSSGCSASVRPEATCSGSAPEVSNASWDMECVSAAIVGVECTATCSATAASRIVAYTSKCSEPGVWSTPIGGGCSASNSSDVTKPKSCTTPPPTVEGVLWEACDTAAGGSNRCSGLCQKPYRGLGYYTVCNASGEWDTPEKQLKNDVGCKVVSCAGGVLSPVQGATWDTSCGAAGSTDNVCFARCAANPSKAAYMAECTLEGTWSEPQKMASC